MIQSTFFFQITPDKVLEVTAPNVADAINVAAQALSHLCATESERAHAVLVSDAISYTLTCLCCHVVNPQHAERTLLVAMQEHLMACHGLTQAELARATRVFWGTHQEGCFLWWTPAHGAMRQLSHVSTAVHPVLSP